MVDPDEREELYRALFEVNAAIKLLIDPADGAIVDANSAAVAFYGWSLDELRAMRISQINVPPDAQLAIEMARARAHETPAFHFQHRTRAGALRDVEVYSGPVVVRGRQLLFSIIHDVTERNRLEDELRRTQRLEAVGRLAAGIAHDFNNLLAVALASVELAQLRLAPDHAAVPHLTDVRRAVQHGAELTRQMLAFARQQVLAPVNVELGLALPRVAAMLGRVLGDHIEVTVDVAATLPPIRVDPGQLELAILNLALNARDAMPEGGRLILRAVERDGRVCICIEDTGFGMDAETRARAFEPFHTTKPTGRGTGLGLATVYGLAQQSGGDAWIDSAPGAGTRVYLAFPIASAPSTHAPATATPALALTTAGEPACARASPAARTSARCAAQRIVLVDDREDLRNALALALGEAGLIVHPAASATAALDRLAELGGAVDVVLSDVTMPDRSGLELAADVHARWPDLPVVLMSGNATHPSSDAAIAGWIDKPFTIDDVVAALDRAARSR